VTLASGRRFWFSSPLSAGSASAPESRPVPRWSDFCGCNVDRQGLNQHDGAGRCGMDRAAAGVGREHTASPRTADFGIRGNGRTQIVLDQRWQRSSDGIEWILECIERTILPDNKQSSWVRALRYGGRWRRIRGGSRLYTAGWNIGGADRVAGRTWCVFVLRAERCGAERFRVAGIHSVGDAFVIC